MKKIVVSIFVFALCVLFFNQKEETVSAVQLENIEALAGDKTPRGVLCYGSGSMLCSNGVRVKTILDSSERDK